MKNIRYPLLLIFLILSVNSIYSQLNLSYPIKNYSTDDYMAGTQNWGITELNDGTICFANNEGLLVKNSNDWSLYKTKHKKALRTIFEYTDKIYAGGEEFGYFTKSFNGSYRYTSLSDKVSIKWGEIWKIEVLDNKVYLQGGKGILVFDAINDTLINQFTSDNIIHFSIKNRKVLLQTENGLFYLDDNFENKDILCTPEDINGLIIRSTFEIDNKLILFTLNKGVFEYANGKLNILNKPIHKIGLDTHIYFVKRVGIQFFLGTVLDGIYILDQDLNILNHIDISSGLKNNTILSLTTDHNANVWIGYDNGAGYIDINTRCLNYKFDKNIGSGYASIKKGNYSYWGTNQGLFYTKDDNGGYNVNLINNTKGQVWCLKKIGNDIYCGHHYGLYKIDNSNALQIDNTLGVMNIIQLSDSNYYFLRCYHSLLLYKLNEGRLTKVGNIESPINIPRDIKKDKNGALWFAQENGVVKFEINTEKLLIEDYQIYNHPGDKHIFVFDNNILLWNQECLLMYDRDNDKFVDVANLKYTAKSKGDLIELFYCIPPEILSKKIKGCNEFIRDLEKIKGQMKWDVKMYVNYDDYYILNGNNGFVNFNFTRPLDYLNKIKVVLSEIKVKSKSDTEYDWIENDKLIYNKNNIRFKFSSNDDPNIEYQYKLIGYDENYSLFSSKNIKEYTNLPEGAYRFEVRAKDKRGEMSEIESFEFSIFPPFYRSNLAKIVYGILLILGLIGLFYAIRYFLKRKERQLNLVRQKEIQELEKNHKIETLSKEKTIILIDKERLEESIAHKQRELANSTHNVIVKNNLLMDIKEQLQSIYKEKNTDLRDSKLSKIFSHIDMSINNEEDWAVFENYFSEIHQNFFDNLKKDFPEISSTDLKLCAYIRLNKSTKEIASLMNISIRGVETSRYRLRKKLNLDRNGNIYDLLAKY